MVLIFIGTQIVSYVPEFTIVLTTGNIITGLMISSVIGFIAGFNDRSGAGLSMNYVTNMITAIIIIRHLISNYRHVDPMNPDAIILNNHSLKTDIVFYYRDITLI